jgi:hypothetical protein
MKVKDEALEDRAVQVRAAGGVCVGGCIWQHPPDLGGLGCRI